jgi:hypothetical protein
MMLMTLLRVSQWLLSPGPTLRRGVATALQWPCNGDR